MMQQEMDSIVFNTAPFRPQRSRVPTAAPASGQLAPGEIVRIKADKESLDSKDHFENGMRLSAEAEQGMPFDPVYSDAHTTKDTESHFKDLGMTLADEADQGMEFDAVYSLAHANKDTASHFKDLGMELEDSPGARERNAARLAKFEEAKRTAAQLGNPQAKKAMGHDAKDSESHFKGMLVQGETGEAFDKVYSMAHAAKDTETHFEGQGYVLDPSVDASNSFDRVYGQEHVLKDTEDHFIGGTMLIAPIGDEWRRTRHRALPKHELAPPARPKFLLRGGTTDAPYVPKVAAHPKMWSQGVKERAQMISHDLACKFDEFTRTREDHMRKLVWTFGTDAHFQSASNKQVMVTPSNLGRVCDRFGVSCTVEEAKEVFKQNNISSKGVNVYNLARRFHDSPFDTSNLEYKQHKGQSEARATANKLKDRMSHVPMSRTDPFKHARLPDLAWKAHAEGSSLKLPPVATPTSA